jgi:transketolase
MLTDVISRQITPTQPEKAIRQETPKELASGADSPRQTMSFGPRRGVYINAADRLAEEGDPLDQSTVEDCETFDLIYRTLCAVMYNYAPLSGHPGGSISSGRFVARLLFDVMDYDLSSPNRLDADIISYAAGHKALGLYAMWALRNEIARIAAPEL